MDQLEFWILDEGKKALYKNSSGLIVNADTSNMNADGFPAHLKFAPKSWQDTLVKYARNPKSLGATRDFTVPLDFVKDGESIILDGKWRQGSDVIRYLVVNTLNKVAFPDRYNHFYTGELDCSKAIQKKDWTTVQVTEGGLSKLLKANEGTQYEIPINSDPERKKLYFSGMPFKNTIEYEIFNGQEIRQNTTNIGMGIIAREGFTQGIAFQDQNLTDFDLSNPDENWFSKSFTKTTTLFCEGTINFTVVQDGSAVVMKFVKVAKQLDGSQVVTPYFLPITTGALSPGDYSFDYTRLIDMQPNCQLYLQDDGQLSGGAIVYHKIKKSSLRLNYEVTFDDTNVEGLSPKRVAQLLLDRIAPGYTVSSTFLDSFEDVIFLTSGQALRSYGATAVFKTSWNDFFQSFKRFGTGYDTVNETLVFEKHGYFFRPTVSMSLGVVKDYAISDASDLVFNTFKFGSPVVDMRKVNGRDEPNFITHFTSPLKREVKEMDLSTVYQTGMYPIEIARTSFFRQDTTDSQVDNTPYMINVNKGVVIDYYTGPFEVISSTQINIPGRHVQPTFGVDNLIITGTGTDGTFLITNGILSDDLTELAAIGGGFIPGSYTGTLQLSAPTTYKLNRPAFTNVTGLIHPNEAFNLLLDPKRAMLDNGSYIRSIMNYHDADDLVYTKGDGQNNSLSTTISGITVTENTNQPIGGLDPQIFKPYYIKFTTRLPINYNTVMNNSPYELVEFELSDIPNVTWTGYTWDGGMNPGTNESQEWVLLFGPNNDMTKLIKK